MRNSDLPNLRGLIKNAALVKTQVVASLNHAKTYADRSGLGYSPAATALADFLQAALDANRKFTRAASIDATPATKTLAAAATQQIAVSATYADGVTEALASSDRRVTYASSDATKATVSASGLVTAVATGSATITVTYQGRTDTVAITVS